jgi:hypothetical protein
MDLQYVYLLQEREFIKTKEPVYKIGKTKQPNATRFLQYPKESSLIFQSSCIDCDTCERQIIAFFKNKYIHRTDIGNEYYEGNCDNMLIDISEINLNLLKNKKITEKNLLQIPINYIQNNNEEKKHEDTDKEHISNKSTKTFSCLLCNYSTNLNTSLQRHFTSKKHKTNKSPIYITPTNFQCKKCSKYYKGQSGLWGHKQTCV